ncbi:MAG: alpha/beta hydrolase domain-containing protein, partial [Novipirellula sp. JB048]
MLVEVDPEAAANARIHDLHLAERNERGRVECWTDFFLLKPVDASRGNRCILYDVNNRGNKLALEAFNGARSNDPTTLADAGNGFLMEKGYSILWCGWNGDVTEDGKQRLLVELPIAREHGKTITGRAHVEISSDEKTFSQAFYHSPWGTSQAYPAVDLDNRHATLTQRPNRSETATEVPRDQWAFARWEDDTLVPDATHLYLKNGFQPGWVYDLVYTAKNPRVTGLGLAALRDCVSFFRYAIEDSEGTPNPLAQDIDRAYVFGISQSGRLIHHFIYEGFNRDESARDVFEGALIHVAGAGKGNFNYRFRMTTRYGTQHENQLAGSEFFPLAPSTEVDAVTGRQGSSLDHARRNGGQVPKMMFVQTSTEYWNRAASLLHTDTAGRRDLTVPEEVRIYLVAGANHLGKLEHTRGICQQPRNTLDDRPPILRALLVALDRWVDGGIEPPPSRYPRIDDGTLVDLPTFQKQFPKIPGVNLPERFFQPHRLDFGPRFRSAGIADTIPPKIGKPFRT